MAVERERGVREDPNFSRDRLKIAGGVGLTLAEIFSGGKISTAIGLASRLMVPPKSDTGPFSDPDNFYASITGTYDPKSLNIENSTEVAGKFRVTFASSDRNEGLDYEYKFDHLDLDDAANIAQILRYHPDNIRAKISEVAESTGKKVNDILSDPGMTGPLIAGITVPTLPAPVREKIKSHDSEQSTRRKILQWAIANPGKASAIVASTVSGAGLALSWVIADFIRRNSLKSVSPDTQAAFTRVAIASSTLKPSTTPTVFTSEGEEPNGNSTATTTPTVTVTVTETPTATATEVGLKSYSEIFGRPPDISWISPMSVDNINSGATWNTKNTWTGVNKSNGQMEITTDPRFEGQVFKFIAAKDIDVSTGPLRMYPNFYTKERTKGAFNSKLSFVYSDGFITKSRAVIISLFNSIADIPDSRASNKRGDLSIFANVNILADGSYEISSVAPFSSDEKRVRSSYKAKPGVRIDAEFRFDGKETLELIVGGKSVLKTSVHPAYLLPENSDLKSTIGGHAGGYIYDTTKGEFIINSPWSIEAWNLN